MGAVVGEPGGTAYMNSAMRGLSHKALKCMAKPGQPNAPTMPGLPVSLRITEAAVFPFPVIVEGGQSGGADAAPLARNIIQFCIDAGYIGTAKRKIEVLICTLKHFTSLLEPKPCTLPTKRYFSRLP